MRAAITIDRKVFAEPPPEYADSHDIMVQNCNKDAEELLRLLGRWRSNAKFHASFEEGEVGAPDQLRVWVNESRYDTLSKNYAKAIKWAHQAQAELDALKERSKTLLDGTANRMRNTSDLRAENARLRNALHAMTQPDEVRSEG